MSCTTRQMWCSCRNGLVIGCSLFEGMRWWSGQEQTAGLRGHDRGGSVRADAALQAVQPWRDRDRRRRVVRVPEVAAEHQQRGWVARGQAEAGVVLIAEQVGQYAEFQVGSEPRE